MTREELVAHVESLGKASAEDFPQVSELLEFLYCVLRVEREEMLVRNMGILFNVDLWREVALSQDLEEEHAG